MLLQLQRYDLDIAYHPGNQQVIADVLSRFPVGQPSPEELTSQEVFGVQLDKMVTQEIEVIRPPDFIEVWGSTEGGRSRCRTMCPSEVYR